MWWFPALSVITALGIVLVLVQMGLTEDVRIQLVLSLVSFGIVLVLFFINRARIARLPERVAPDHTGEARRVLVLANQTLEADELMRELQRIDAMGKATYYVCVPASAVETGTASTHGAVSVAEATTEAAQARLDRTLDALTAHHLDATGGLGDYRPLRALRAAVSHFDPDQIVIVTLPASDSIWQRFEVVDRAGELGLPVTHVEAASLVMQA
jgi:GABA permease